MEDAPRAVFWKRRARRTALRHNAARVVAGFLPLCLSVSAAFACALLIARQHAAAGPVVWTIYGVALLVCAAVAAWRARKAFFTVADAIVRLEWHLHLHNRLSAAAAGVGEYPPEQDAPDGYAFRWEKIALPVAGAAALVLAAAWIPVSNRALAFIPVVPPVAWTQASQWLDTLTKSDLLQRPALEDLRERLEQLRKQPAQDWYSQSSLEAGDNLREQTAQSIEALQRDLQSALNNVEAMQRFNEQTSPTEMKAARENLDNALKGLELGNLPLDHELLDSLKGLDPSKIKSLTPAQLAELKKRLKEGGKICKACLHPGEGGDKDGDAALIVAAAGANAPFSGAPGPGGGHEPLTLNEKPTELGTTRSEAVSNPNLDNALPGDIVGVGKGEHTVDPTKYTGPTSAGAAARGEGGEAVWHDDLSPKEREVLRDFFK